MLRFETHQQDLTANGIDLSGAYLFGADGIPVRGELTGNGSVITCRKRVAGAVGLSLLWDAGSAGQFMLPTTRLPERNEPYSLIVELARARMKRIAQKFEEWGLFDYANAEELLTEFNEIRGPFIQALHEPDLAKADELASQALEAGVTLSEKIALFHADVFLDRRRNSAAAAARTRFGVGVSLDGVASGHHDRLREAFDFLSIPITWTAVEPRENVYQFPIVDTWVNFAARAHKPIHIGPVVDFDPSAVPEWLYLWEHDYDTLREIIYKHLEHIINRYSRQAKIWSVVSGLHAHNNFNLSFEQIMELTRMCCQLAKRLAPRSQIMIDLIMPWGEYYARNSRTIPPLLYADMAVQSGVKFDAFGVQLHMGIPEDGNYVRDLMQISSLLDEFVTLRKPLHITACSVPSQMAGDIRDAWNGELDTARAGRWHAPWSQRLQAEWLQAFYRICISKPFVESICWRDLGDDAPHHLPHSALCTDENTPKLAFKELRNFRAAMASVVAELREQIANDNDSGNEDGNGNDAPA